MLQEKIDDLTKKRDAINAWRVALDTDKFKAEHRTVKEFCEAKGFHNSQVSRWMNGGQEPTWDNIKAFTRALVDAGLMTEKDYETHCG